MNIFFDIVIALALLAVLATFVLGMVAFSKNGSEAGAKLNRMMAWRVRTQVIAIVLLLISMWWKSQHPGI